MTPDDERGDEWIRPMVRRIEQDAAAADRAFLEQLRERSAAVFAAGPAAPVVPSQRGRTMGRLLGLLAAVAAAAAIIYFGFFHTSEPNENPAFAKVLDEVNNADTLHLKVTRGGTTGEIWVEKRGRFRHDAGGEGFRIYDGEMFWRVDPKTGRGERLPDKPTTNVLDIALAGEKAERFNPNQVELADRIERGGKTFLVYRVTTRAAGGNLDLEALVDADNRQLHSLRAKAVRDGKATILSEVELVSTNQPLPEEKFAILHSLSEDGRVGKVVEVQGVVTVKSLEAERWTPAADHLVLMPGDFVRTDVRGANAIATRLLSKATVIAGPASLVELPKAGQVKLHEGEIEIRVPKDLSVELFGPDDQKTVVKGTQFYRVDRNGKLLLSNQTPLWLKGFKGTIAGESLGSLIAKVDGRSVPLSVGYHKVTVDIRDQIARTVVEESFVNHTDTTLEGVFHFPLPQDASISGFGMWIGNELIDADVVEKQRARDIYEQIKRERRDPGLLEWSGGNIFTARVWPIFGRSEKRIKITYTQVLPLRGSSYRYSYALQSELLQQHPLRDLSINVFVHSAVPLQKVRCLTHSTRDQMSKNSAKIEFTAQEYTPKRDFEVIVEQGRGAADVVMIPHRRGDDGYFMLQLMPPYQETVGVAPAGPVRLLILADTSASMDRGQRQKQDALIATLLAMLTPNDRFNLATCDVACDWVFPKAVEASPKNLAAARDMLDKRQSLGWTDLDKAFASALAMSDADTHVVYIGDGVVTTGDADPVAFAKRLKHAYAGKHGTFHAITVGSSYESGVLKAIASLGGGSTRRVAGDQSPGFVAAELMNEITRPTLRDVKVEFHGLRTARVYPEQLPNVSAGTQQILLGRYLPQNRDQSGEIVVTGMLAGKPVRMSAKVDLKDAEQGNSFIPRLWARMHLDALLDQGASEAIKDEVIALSEEYSIITPYTSFLVLESDADRERFGVKRRFQMRDGEKFFAQSRDNVQYELVQQQMKRAGLWRLNLRRDVLRSLSGLGRDQRWLRSELLLDERDDKVDLYDSAAAHPVSSTSLPQLQTEVDYEWDSARRAGEKVEVSGGSELGKKLTTLSGNTEPESYFKDLENNVLGIDDSLPLQSDKRKFSQRGESLAREIDEVRQLALEEMPSTPYSYDLPSGDSVYTADGSGGGFAGRASFGYYGKARRRYDDSIHWRQQWWQLVFPPLPRSAISPAAKQAEWSEDILKRVASLQRAEKLRHLAGGLEVVRVSESFHYRRSTLQSRNRFVGLYSRAKWLSLHQPDQSATIVHWSDGRERGLLNRAFQIGRVRPAVPDDVSDLLNEDWAFDRQYAEYVATLEPAGEKRMRLLLKPKAGGAYETRVMIDTSRNVVLALEHFSDGKLQSTQKYDDFVEVAGLWWWRKSEYVNEKGIVVSRSTQIVTPWAADAFERRMTEELAGKDDAFITRSSLPKIEDAKKAQAAKKATLEDHVTLLQHFAAIQQWTKVREQLDAIEKLAGKKGGYRWLADAVLFLSRRFEELRQRHLDEAARLVATRGADNDVWAIATHLASRSQNFMNAAEMLTLLDRLQPVDDRQPAHVRARISSDQLRIQYLPGVGKQDEALALAKKLAVDFPFDENLQRQYVQMLANRRDFASAYAWIKQVLVRDNDWEEWEEENFRTQLFSLLQQEGNLEQLLAELTDWMKKNPSRESAYSMYLSTLVRLDQEAKANETAERWLQEGRKADEIPGDAAARLTASIQYAMGQGYHLHTNRIEERWHRPLGELVRFFARSEKHGRFADIAMHNSNFTALDEAQKIRSEIAGRIVADARTLAPQRIERMVFWLQPNDPEVPADTWKKLADLLRDRWSAESKPEVKGQLGSALLTVLRHWRPVEDLLAFLRLQWQNALPQAKPYYARQLFDTLLAQPYKPEYENELFGLIATMPEQEDAGRRLAAQIQALYQIGDRMVEARTRALNGQIERPDKLTRTELRAKQDANQKAAREGYAERLTKELAAAPADLAPWIKMERMYLDVRLDRRSAQVAADCWEILGGEPPQPPDADKPLDAKDRLGRLLKDRALTMLMWLAVQPRADAKQIDRLLEYIDKGMAREGEASDWRALKHRALIALDRPKELEAGLRTWAAAGDGANLWKLQLGFLLAEMGKLEDAVTLFESIEAADELGPLAYRTLAGWYHVLNRREQHERATIASYRAMEEHHLSQMIQQKLHPWQRGDRHLPSELDKEVLWMFAAIFEKSAHPQNYLHQLQQFYQACRDFRLLGTLADAVIGQTAGKIYPFLQSMGAVFQEIRDEATVDEMMEHLNRVRARAKSPIDQRALDLMEVLVRRRAAELQNQPAPHGNKALEAMRRAFDRQWSDGEQPLMAHLLAGLGRIAYAPLADEQLRELESLHREQKAGAYRRLDVGHQLGRTYFIYNQHQPALDVLFEGLRDFAAAHMGVLPVDANPVITTLISFLQQRSLYQRGESLLLDELKRPVHAQQKLWLTQQLHQHYHAAIVNDGEVSLGKGAVLYKALEGMLRAAADSPDAQHHYQVLDLLCRVYRTAHRLKFSEFAGDLRQFAFKLLPELLKRHPTYYDSTVQMVSSTLRDTIGAQAGLAFLLDRIDNEPAWLRLNNQDGWSRYGYSLAQWRTEIKELGDLEPRLLKIVLGELRRDLESRSARNRHTYYFGYSYYWPEKEPEFVKTAESVYAERKQSGASVKYIAEYLYYGVRRHARAIEILFAAHEANLLDETGQVQLIGYLQDRNRHPEAIALLLPLVEKKPEALDYRLRLMASYHATKQTEKLLATLKSADAFFRDKGRWSESIIAALAQTCLNTELYDASVAYYTEVIPLHQRAHANRGVGNATLSEYYDRLGLAYSRLGKTADAVDAVSGAIVAWPMGHNQRQRFLQRLQEVLTQSPNLDAYVEHLDRNEAESGQSSPILRKALGQAYEAKNECAKALAQFRIAAELQPEDAETHQQMIACYDRLQDKEGAIRQLYQAIQATRRNLLLYEALGVRYEELNRSVEAERAFTSIVEMQALESESHTKLAQIRQRQNRWSEAAQHWRRVADLQTLEPTGLLELTKNYIQQKDWEKASESLTQLEKKAWPARFSNVREEISSLRVQVERGRKMEN